jgi:hypothetical protein
MKELRGFPKGYCARSQAQSRSVRQGHFFVDPWPAMLVHFENGKAEVRFHQNRQLCVNHVDLAPAALRTHEPLPPFEDEHLRAISPGLLSRIRLEPMLAGLAPEDEVHVGRGGFAERHRRAGLGFTGVW